MKTKLTLALAAILSGTAFGSMPAVLPEFKNEKQLAEWRDEMVAKHAATTTATEDHAFYTGKPYIESTASYTFKYRSYNPVLARWTSEDPSGFPDGANGNIYAPVPTSQFDFEGLQASRTFADQVHSISISVYLYDSYGLITQATPNAWKSAVEAAWIFSGIDASNQQSLSLNLSVNFTLQVGGVFDNNWHGQYDNCIKLTNQNVLAQVCDNRLGIWNHDELDRTVIHEFGHFMETPDKYVVSYLNGLRITDPESPAWVGSIMGDMKSSASKNDANLVLRSLGENTHLFE